MKKKSSAQNKVVMPDIRLITVDQIYANMRTKMRAVVGNTSSTASDKKNAIRVLNMPKNRIISTGDFGIPCSACRAISSVVVAFNNEYALCDSCLGLANQIMAGGENHASDYASNGSAAN